MVSEAAVETYLVNRVKELGGLALKGAVPSHRFIDRICIMPDGVTLWVECKRPKGGSRSALQELTVMQLIDLGHFAFFVKNKEEVDMILDWSRFFGDDGELIVGGVVNPVSSRYELYRSTPKGLVKV